jgi:hypothetical protein
MANSLLEEIQKRMGGEFALGQQELANQYANKPGGGIPLEAYARQVSQQLANEEAEAIERNAMQNGGSGLMASYDQDPLGQTRRPVTDDTSARSIVDDGTWQSALYGVIEPHMTRNISDNRLSNLFDYKNYIGAYADVLGKSLSKTENPTFTDALMGAANVGALASNKMLGTFIQNLRNYVPGFYGGNPQLGVARNALLGGVDSIKDFTRQFYSNTNVSSATEKVIKAEQAKYLELKALGEKDGFTDEIKAGMRSAARKIHGQIGQNIVHGRMMGEVSKDLQPWATRNFGEEIPFDRQLAEEMFDDVDAKMIYDMSNDAWGGVSGGFSGKAPTEALFINKKNTRVAGNSFNDIVSSRQFKTLRRLNAKHNPQTADEWIRVLDEYDPNWKKNISISNVVQGSDGVMFQFSPAGKQDYLLGGFNAIIKVKNDGTAKMFGTDKQDIFNQKIPGGADAIVGIGNQKAVNFGGKSDPKLTELIEQKVPKYTPPKKKTSGDDVTIESAKKSQQTQKKKEKGYDYLLNEDNAILNSILGNASNISPTRTAATTGVATGLIEGFRDED